jgi:hypothetical protein
MVLMVTKASTIASKNQGIEGLVLALIVRTKVRACLPGRKTATKLQHPLTNRSHRQRSMPVRLPRVFSAARSAGLQSGQVLGLASIRPEKDFAQRLEVFFFAEKIAAVLRTFGSSPRLS